MSFTEKTKSCELVGYTVQVQSELEFLQALYNDLVHKGNDHPTHCDVLLRIKVLLFLDPLKKSAINKNFNDYIILFINLLNFILILFGEEYVSL